MLIYIDEYPDRGIYGKPRVVLKADADYGLAGR